MGVVVTTYPGSKKVLLVVNRWELFKESEHNRRYGSDLTPDYLRAKTWSPTLTYQEELTEWE